MSVLALTAEPSPAPHPASPQCHLQRLGAVVLGADGQGVLQEPQGQVVLHDPMEHQANVVLHREPSRHWERHTGTAVPALGPCRCVTARGAVTLASPCSSDTGPKQSRHNGGNRLSSVCQCSKNTINKGVFLRITGLKTICSIPVQSSAQRLTLPAKVSNSFFPSSHGTNQQQPGRKSTA